MDQTYKSPFKVVELENCLSQEETKSPDNKKVAFNRPLSKGYKTNANGFGLNVRNCWFD
jgi:hypothetical protein